LARYHTRCNLSAARFPFISSFHGRSVILPQQDINFQKSAIFGGADADRDVGVPQVFYMHNTIPTEQGYQSIGYEQVIEPMLGEVDFDNFIPLQDVLGNKFLFVPGFGKNYVFDAPTLGWAKINPIVGLETDILVTAAFVQGVNYVFYEKTGCFRYNSTTKAFDPVTLTGLTVANIVGIVGSNGYLLAWDINNVLYWTPIPTDFTPSLVTGASSASITDLKGRIVTVHQAINGFIIYSTGNAVGATFTGNIRFPFNMKEIPGAGGVRTKEHISYEYNADSHYAITSAGVQEINKTSSKLLLPEAADFISGRIFEDFDSATKLFTTTYLTGDTRLKLAVVAARYLIISYGMQSLTHAIVYDFLQKKWGKLKIAHVDCFEYTYPNLYGIVTYQMLLSLGTTYDELIDTTYNDLNSVVATAERPRRTIAFLQQDGTVYIVEMNPGQIDNDSVILFGRYQFTRGHMMQLFEIDIENIDQGSNYACFILPSYDGKNFAAAVTPTVHNSSGLVRSFRSRVTAINHTLLFVGSFNLCSYQISYTPAGVARVHANA